MKTKVLIISVIDFPNKKLSYSHSRSVFSPKERLEQVKKTVNSIKDKLLESEIYLIEAGNKNYESEFKYTNLNYIYCGNKYFIKKAISSPYKAIGEIFSLLYGIKNISKENEPFLIFKISGRYFLNDNFDINKWSIKKFNFKEAVGTYSTRLYLLPSKYLSFYKIILLLSIPLSLINVSIEKTLYILMPGKLVQKIEILGMGGNIATNGNIINE